MAVTPGYNNTTTISLVGGTGTKSGATIGTASDDRIVVCGITWEGNADFSSATIGGIACSGNTGGSVKAYNTTGTDHVAALFWALVPTGTTADIVVNSDVSLTVTARLSIWACIGGGLPATDTDTGTGAGVSIALSALTVPTDGAAMFCWVNNTDTTATTWTGATERDDTDAGTWRHSVADTTTAGTNTITSDGATADQGIVGVAFGINKTLAPSLYTDTDTFYVPQMSPVNLTPSLFNDGTDTFYAPTMGQTGMYLYGVAEGSSTTGATFDITLPAGTAENDIVLVVGGVPYLHASGGNDPGPTSGYTDVYASQTFGSGTEIRVAYKRMSASPDTTVTCGNGDFVGSKAGCAIAMVWRGVDTTTAIDVSVPSPVTGSDDIDPPSITPVTNTGVVIAVMGIAATAEGAITQPSGYTLAADEQVSGFQPASVAAAYKYQSTAAAEDPGAFTTAAAASWAGTIALRNANPQTVIMPNAVFTDSDTFYVPVVVGAQGLSPALFTNTNVIFTAAGDTTVEYTASLQTADFTQGSGVATFADVDIGDADAGRLVFVYVYASCGGTTGAPELTIGGVTATRVVTGTALEFADDATDGALFFWALVPTGTTADITFDTNETDSDWAVIDGLVYRVTGVDTETPVDAMEFADGGTPAVVALDIADNSAALAVSIAIDVDTAWTGVTEDVDSVSILGGAGVASGGHYNTTSAEVGRDIEAIGDTSDGVTYLSAISFVASGGGQPEVTLGVGTGTQNLEPSLFTDGDTFFVPTVTPGAIALTPSLFNDGTDTFNTHVIGQGYQLFPALLDDGTDTFFSPTVAPGLVNLTPSLFNDGTDTFFTPIVGQNAITPGLYTDADTFFTHVITTGAVGLTPGFFKDGTATNTGLKIAGAGANVAGANVDWGTPSNITADDATNAQASYVSSSGDTDALKASTFAANVPSNAIITGIEVLVEASALVVGTTATLKTINVGKSDGTLGTPTSPAQSLSTTPTVYTYGSSTDLWGLTWTADEVNASTFQARVVANVAVSGFASLSVDYIQVKVYYTDLETFYTPTVINVLSPLVQTSTFTDGDTFYVPTITRSTINLQPSLLDNSTDTFFTPTVAGGVVTLQPSLFNDGTDTFYSPIVSGVTTFLLPSLFNDGTDTFYSPTVTGAQALVASLITDGDTFYSPTVDQTNLLLHRPLLQAKSIFPRAGHGI